MSVDLPKHFPDCANCARKIIGTTVANLENNSGSIECKPFDKKGQKIVSGVIVSKVSRKYVTAVVNCPAYSEK